MARSVICVSHAAGARGRELATAVADQLGYRYIDDEIMARAAASEKVTVADLADVERRKSFFARLMSDFGRSGAAMYGIPYTPPELYAAVSDPDMLRHAIRHAIEEVADEGRVVIVSHAASHALTGDNVLRLLVVAPEADRRVRLAAAQQADPDGDQQTLEEHDAGRRDYLKRFYGIDREAPDQYDLVVNTGRIDPAAFVPVIVQAADL
jgi:cytidylate kinase